MKRHVALLIAAGTCVPLGLSRAVVVAAPTASASLVNVGSPPDMTPRNHQNEPAVAMDANNPDFLVAGSNDFIDQQVCPQTTATQQGTCDTFTQGIGLSGVYFSFDRGHTWMQPTYTGWQARNCGSAAVCPGSFGPIGRIPWYFESGLVDDGDPAVAVGPMPDSSGHFAWSNGSRVYYANLTSNFPGRSTFKGFESVAVSRLDNPTPDSVQMKSSWMHPVLISDIQSSTAFDDKEQVWADNAASSPFFGNAYVCFAQFRSVGLHRPANVPAPLMLATSHNGGSTWNTQQITPADTGGKGVNEFGLSGCTVRTDSHGVVDVFAEMFQNSAFTGLPTHGSHVIMQSFDGGHTFTKPRVLFSITDPCFFIDPLSQRCVMDGFTGARTDLAASPSVDIANGAPSGADATNLVLDAWADASAGLNNEDTRVAWSSNGGRTFSAPTSISLPGDRPIYAAPALSPSGDRAYVVYEAVTSPWRSSDMTSPRPYHGVFLSAPVGTSGPGTFDPAFVGPFGDIRASYPGHRLWQERIGDYVYAAASRAFGVGVWLDAGNASVCDAIQAYRGASLANGSPVTPAPWPLADCAPTFGNTDVMAATTG